MSIHLALLFNSTVLRLVPDRRLPSLSLRAIGLSVSRCFAAVVFSGLARRVGIGGGGTVFIARLLGRTACRGRVRAGRPVRRGTCITTRVVRVVTKGIKGRLGACSGRTLLPMPLSLAFLPFITTALTAHSGRCRGRARAACVHHRVRRAILNTALMNGGAQRRPKDCGGAYAVVCPFERVGECVDAEGGKTRD